MNIHQSVLRSHLANSTVKFLFAKREVSATAEARQASTPDDFMQLTRMMKTVSRTRCIPIDPNRIGRTLSRLNHGGSGPQTGCAVVAHDAEGPAGFALVLVKPGTGMELTWLHADGDNEQLKECIWRKVLQIKDDWHFSVLHVGMFAQMPKSVIAAIGDC